MGHGIHHGSTCGGPVQQCVEVREVLQHAQSTSAICPVYTGHTAQYTDIMQHSYHLASNRCHGVDIHPYPRLVGTKPGPWIHDTICGSVDLGS